MSISSRSFKLKRSQQARKKVVQQAVNVEQATRVSTSGRVASRRSSSSNNTETNKPTGRSSVASASVQIPVAKNPDAKRKKKNPRSIKTRQAFGRSCVKVPSISASTTNREKKALRIKVKTPVFSEKKI